MPGNADPEAPKRYMYAFAAETYMICGESSFHSRLNTHAGGDTDS